MRELAQARGDEEAGHGRVLLLHQVAARERAHRGRVRAARRGQREDPEEQVGARGDARGARGRVARAPAHALLARHHEHAPDAHDGRQRDAEHRVRRARRVAVDRRREEGRRVEAQRQRDVAGAVDGHGF